MNASKINAITVIWIIYNYFSKGMKAEIHWPTEMDKIRQDFDKFRQNLVISDYPDKRKRPITAPRCPFEIRRSNCHSEHPKYCRRIDRK